MTIASSGTSQVSTEELSADQGVRLFENNCRRELGVSADEFLAAYDAGEYPSAWSRRAVQRLEYLVPFVRPAA